MQRRVRAVFVRGGTSRALVFHRRDLPRPSGGLGSRSFSRALGSPDPYGRQLDGLGGGISSLSKVAVVGPSSRPDADVDYTFGQVEVTRAAVDYRGNCGNISSAIGPFAIDEALLPAREPATVVRIHNTNTQKVIHAHVPVESGQAAVRGDFALDGVPGTGARIALDFLDPGGAVTGRLLPTGRAQDLLEVPELGPVSASLVDATNPMVFVRAKDLGLDGTERPEDLDGRPGLPARLEAIRAAAAVRMGLARTPEEASRTSTAVPKIAIVAPPAAYRTLAGATVESRRRGSRGAHRVDGQGPPGLRAHRRDVPGRRCPHPGHARPRGRGARRRGRRRPASATPRVSCQSPPRSRRDAMAPRWPQTVTVYRTARRLMEGFVLVP